ncbi:MAG TPA: histidine phosphatase family protein [Burkholderiales bacterium]
MSTTGSFRQFSPRHIMAVLAALLGFCGPCAAASDPGTPDPGNAKSGAALVSALRQGGQVIYFRHADTGPAYQEQGVDLKRCDTQRNLNDKGRVEAEQIGGQFRRLRIPVGEVFSSEFCRCRETAELAFERYTIEASLTGVSRSAEAAPRRELATAGLRKLLAKAPQPATNTVLVSHGYNLWDAEGFHLGTQGEAAIFRPDGQGGYVLVARLTPEQWGQLPER